MDDVKISMPASGDSFKGLKFFAEVRDHSAIKGAKA
jgi:hypothetical protein